ncbi:hypothetical protein J3458_013324 [Metarhizium acridum]|uniref:uncharacterized protein n=1 Tax=Metarhizium acridum TaxID=92637 RepID=UPI001C6BABD4|nr:hypothetical protein J3458_013324 [Metarhizium acridum]
MTPLTSIIIALPTLASSFTPSGRIQTFLNVKRGEDNRVPQREGSLGQVPESNGSMPRVSEDVESAKLIVVPLDPEIIASVNVALNESCSQDVRSGYKCAGMAVWRNSGQRTEQREFREWWSKAPFGKDPL